MYHSLAYISTYIPSTYFYKEQKGGVQENGIIISFLENWDHFKYRDDSSFLVCLLTYLIIETVLMKGIDINFLVYYLKNSDSRKSF